MSRSHRAAQCSSRVIIALVLLFELVGGGPFIAKSATAQAERGLSDAVREMVRVDAQTVALEHVGLIDGTGVPAKYGYTVIVEGERIAAVGPSGSVTVPDGAERLDLSGHMVIPGIIGLHDHMYYSSVGGSMKLMPYSYPRLFLANGVTTIRTTGSVDSYRELNLRRAIENGEIPGPEIHVTGPYLQGPGPGPGAVHPLSGPDDARRMVRYWAEEGVTWFKAYTQITREELSAAIDEAHRNGVKVTAHLCSVGFGEAVALGIDNLEHGFLTNTEYWPDKQPDVCPTAGDSAIYHDLDMQDPAVQQSIQRMASNNVALTSTLAVMELASASRVPVDERVMDALFPEARSAVLAWHERGSGLDDRVSRELLKKAMAFEREFVKGGGLLAAGSDPCCLNVIAGYGDQRNFELLVEAGFTTEMAVQVMSLNGARVLGIDARVGAIVPGRQADLVVLRGDLTRDPSDIRNPVIVFRKGVGYDSAKLTASVRGLVGIQ